MAVTKIFAEDLKLSTSDSGFESNAGALRSTGDNLQGYTNATSAVSVGDVVAQDPDNDNKVILADADTAIDNPQTGIVVTVVDTTNCIVMHPGGVATGLSGLTKGCYWLSTTAGDMTSSKPSSNAYLVGVAISSTELLVICETVKADGVLTSCIGNWQTEVASDPANTLTLYWIVPTDITITGIKLRAQTQPSSASGTYLFGAKGAGNNLLSTASFDLETLSAAAVTDMTLTTTSADLELEANDLVTFDFVSNNADLQQGGLIAEVIYETANRLPSEKNYIQGMITSYVSTTSISVAAGECLDSENSTLIVDGSAGTVNCATTGAGGLDAGTLSSHLFWHPFKIMKADGTTSQMLVGTDDGATPTFTLPGDYVYKRALPGIWRQAGGALEWAQHTRYGRCGVAVTGLADVIINGAIHGSRTADLSALCPAIATHAKCTFYLKAVNSLVHQTFQQVLRAQSSSPGNAGQLINTVFTVAANVYHIGRGDRSWIALDTTQTLYADDYEATAGSSTITAWFYYLVGWRESGE